MRAKRTRGGDKPTDARTKGGPTARRARPTEPTAASLREIPEVDFGSGIQPHRYARLRSGYKHQVFVDPAVFAFFGSAEAVNEALRLLVKAAELSPARSRRHRRPAA